MKPALQALRELSARIGGDPLLVQAAGGNTSLKMDGVMWIKASGTWLKDALDKDIFVPLDLARLTKALEDNSPACENCMPFVRHDMNTHGLRPSIETSVHALMPQSVVLHVHCVNTIARAICQSGEQRFSQELSGFNWSFIPYARPGLQLAQAIKHHLKPESNVMVLQNHGLAVAADSVAAAEALLGEVVQALQCECRPTQQPHHAALETLCLGTDYQPAAAAEAHAIAFDEMAMGQGCNAVFYPDHVVFLGSEIPLDITKGTPAVCIPGRGVLVHKLGKPAVEPMLRCLADVFRRIAPGEHLKALSAAEVDQLLNWDAETYRQSLQQP
jgi:rhamnose utilization protein RhaD (predicted bifunctional aldolase and dehydrogenase)